MATISGYTARTATSITATVAAGGGETAFDVEANRSLDFASDESIVKTGQVAGAVVMQDLVPDTPYYIRTRKTNGGNGLWSAGYMVATTAPAAAPAPAYNGFSIIPALLVVPEPIDDVQGVNTEAGSVATNLFNDDPLSTWRVAGATGAITFRTTGRAIDTFAFLGTLANEGVTWRIRGATTLANTTAAPGVDTGVVPLRISTGIGQRKHYHGFRRFTQTYNYEWWRIDLAGFNAFFMARHLVVGFARASVNISRGAGHSPVDMGRIERTLFGSPDRVVGWRGRAVDFPLSWISETEYEAKWRDLDQLVGQTDPVLAIPNPKVSQYLNDRIAYGEVTDMRTELMRGTKYARSLTIRSLY